MKRHAIKVLLLALFCSAAYGQSSTTITGTVITYGSGFNTRMRSSTFTLRIKGETPDADVMPLVNLLQERGQDKLRDELRKYDLGTLSIGGSIGRTLNAVRIEHVNGMTRIRAVAERWLNYGELRGGYRSLDYPFSYVELMIDPRTGKGDGTFFPAAQIRVRNKNGAPQVEIEDFGIIPGRITGAEVRGRPLP